MLSIINNKNILTSDKLMLVCPVNCNGVMGKGLALQFKQQYPDMFQKYKSICQNNLLNIGKLWIYKNDNYKHQILCFPTKLNWWQPSKVEYVTEGLQKFVDTYKNKNIASISFPLLGTGCGGLNNKEILSIMTDYLNKCNDCDIEICNS